MTGTLGLRSGIGVAALILPAILAAQETPVSDAVSPDNRIAITPTPDWVDPSRPQPVPDDVQGAVFIRKQDTIIRLTDDGARSYQGQMIRMLQSQALQVGNIAIAWNPASGNAEVHALKIHRTGRVIDVLDTASFEILRREDQLETAMLDGLLTATLQVPDLRVGDDLEIEFSIPLHDPTLGATSHGLLFLGDAPPPGKFRLELSWADGQEPRTRLTPQFDAVAQRGPDAVSLRFDNPSTALPPRDAPPRYAWQRVLEFSDFEDWASVSRRFAQLFDTARALDPDSPLREEADIIAAAHDGDLSRAQAALKLVQQQVRYVYVGLNGGNFTPASADETWQRRYGDCKGKTAMLLTMLDLLGIEAEAVLVNNTLANDGFDQRLPSPGLFDHVLVRAEIEGKTYWLDGTLPPVIEARTDPFFDYRHVLPLDPQGADLQAIVDRPHTLPQQMGLIEYDARAGFEQPAQIVQTTVSRGAAALQEYLQFSSVSANQLKSALASQLEGSRMWDRIEDVRYRFDTATQASILTIIGTGTIDWDADDDGSYSLSLPGGGFSPPSRRQRAAEYGDVPFWQEKTYSCHATTVRLPEGTDLANWDFNSTIDTKIFGRLYYRMMEERDDRTVRMVRGSRVETPEISAARARRDNGRLDDFDNSKARLTYDPSRTMDSWNNPQPVPATYEIDWTGPDAPCLPSDVLSDD